MSYLIDPAAPLGTVIPVTLELAPVFLPPPGGTSLTDPTGAPISFTIANGTITVGAAVPEPTSACMLAISGVALLLATRFARRGGS